MKKINEIIDEKKFTVSVELIPPRNGNDPNKFYDIIERLKGNVDFVSVTRGAGGSLRGGTLPISYFTQHKYGINTIAHFVCRERTKHEIENALMDLYYFGINNVLALRGDAPAGSSEEWDGDYKYAYLLIEHIRNLNNGDYIPRENIDKGKFRKGIKTDFCILAAGHPEDPIEEEIEHIKCKVKEGAEVIITQMVFSFEDYKEYVEGLRKNGIKLPVIAGVRPIVSLKQADSIENFFKLKVSPELKKGLEDKSEEDAKKFGLDYTVDMIKKLKEYGAPGVHLFVLNDIDLAEEVLERV
jgi:methylenetetrahydrofolate reductase (NADPH)|tara:strand:+ start:350 stop:1243 length:894 start_codon:yes stop_codon:yes gene_type:complete